MHPHVRSTLIRASSVALVAAGAMLIAKAATILLTGVQPPLIYEGGQTLFAAGLLGLFLVIRGPSTAGTIGAALAAVAVASGVALLIGTALGVAQVNSETFVMPWSLLYLGLGPGAMLALLLLSVAAFRTRAVGSNDGIPLLLGVLPPILMATAIVHIEVPILLIGMSWVALGVWLLGRSAPLRAGAPGGVPIPKTP